MNRTYSAIAIAALLNAFGNASAEIVIGVAGPMSGQYASFGQQMKAGAAQAVADINATGGIDGERLELKVGDDACDPEQAVEVARRMAGDGVAFVVGHFCSSASIPASKVYARASIIQISPASANPKFTDERPASGIYRVSGREDRQSEVAGWFLAERFPEARIAFLNDGSPYGKGLVDKTRAAYETVGGVPALLDAYVPGQESHAALVTGLENENIDVLYIGGYHADVGLIVRQMRERGLDTVLVSGDALMTEEYWSIAGDAAEGTLVTFLPDPRRNEGASDLVGTFRDHGIEPEGYVLYAYAAVQAWQAAAEAAGDASEHDAMVRALDVGNFDTVLGELSFDDRGDVTLPGYVLYEWKDGRYDYMGE